MSHTSNTNTSAIGRKKQYYLWKQIEVFRKSGWCAKPFKLRVSSKTPQQDAAINKHDADVSHVLQFQGASTSSCTVLLQFLLSPAWTHFHRSYRHWQKQPANNIQ